MNKVMKKFICLISVVTALIVIIPTTTLATTGFPPYSEYIAGKVDSIDTSNPTLAQDVYLGWGDDGNYPKLYAKLYRHLIITPLAEDVVISSKASWGNTRSRAYGSPRPKYKREA